MFIITYKNVIPIQCLPTTGSGQSLTTAATLYNNSSSSARTREVEPKYKSINQTQQWTDQLHSTQMNLEKNQWANQRDKELKTEFGLHRFFLLSFCLVSFHFSSMTFFINFPFVSLFYLVYFASFLVFFIYFYFHSKFFVYVSNIFLIHV